jgi:hypothetical protein
MKSLYGEGLRPAVPVEASSCGESGLVVSRYPAAPPPPTDHNVPVLSSSVSWVTLKSLWEATDSNLPSDLGAVGMVRSITSTWSPPSIHACEQSVFTKFAMCPDPRPLPVRPRGRIAETMGAVGFAMLTTYRTEPKSLSTRSLTTISELPQRSTSSFSKWGSARKPTTCGEAAFAMSRTVMPVQPLT